MTQREMGIHARLGAEEGCLDDILGSGVILQKALGPYAGTHRV